MLLRLEGEDLRLAALSEIARQQMNVARAEEYVEQLLRQQQTSPPTRRATYILKDVRLFLNSVERSVQFLRRSGIEAAIGREDRDGEIMLTIRIAGGTTKA